MVVHSIEDNIARLQAVSKVIPPTRPDYRAWVAIYPFLDFGDDGNGEQQILVRVRIVDIPQQDLDARDGNLEGDELFIVDRLNEIVHTPEQVTHLLSQAGISYEGFGSSLQSGLPF